MNVVMIIGLTIGLLIAVKNLIKCRKKAKEELGKMSLFYTTFNLWLANRQQGKSMEEFFHKRGHKKIAIYGIKELGERLYDELHTTEVEIAYFIDKRAADVREKNGIPVLYPSETLPEVDIIVVTAEYYFADIEKELGNLVNYPIYSVGDILLEM